MRILLLRHGETAGNLEKRYVGRTNEGLTEAAIQALRQTSEKRKQLLYGLLGPVAAVYASPMRRCLETAALVFPEKDFSGVPVRLVPGLSECDFGRFEYKITESFPGMRITSGSSIPAEQTGSREARPWRSSNAGVQTPSGRRCVPLRRKQTYGGVRDPRRLHHGRAGGLWPAGAGVLFLADRLPFWVSLPDRGGERPFLSDRCCGNFNYIVYFKDTK